MKSAYAKSFSLRMACVSMLVACIPGMALANADLADQKDCFSCHSMSETSIGPSYKDVSARYAGRSDAVSVLTSKVLKGGSGSWGNQRMPANKRVNESEARALVEWVLSLKNGS